MTDRKDSIANPTESIKCNECSRMLGSLSSEGDWVFAGKQVAITGEGDECYACEPYDELNAEMQAAEQNFAAVEKRRQNHKGRQDALKELNRTHKNLANFLLQLHQVYESDHAEAPQANEKIQAGPRGEKRPREPSPSSTLDKPSKRRKPGKKSVLFADTVIVREEKEGRSASQFHRGNEEYNKGEHAAPEGSEYLDSSGMDQEYKDFFRERWVGRKWTSLPEPDEDYQFEVDKATPNEEEPKVEFMHEEDREKRNALLGEELAHEAAVVTRESHDVEMEAHETPHTADKSTQTLVRYVDNEEKPFHATHDKEMGPAGSQIKGMETKLGDAESTGQDPVKNSVDYQGHEMVRTGGVREATTSRQGSEVVLEVRGPSGHGLELKHRDSSSGELAEGKEDKGKIPGQALELDDPHGKLQEGGLAPSNDEPTQGRADHAQDSAATEQPAPA
ncbi:hypothetical protein BDV96DRAFT_652105 [Lophiotrema nucula]|uniref:Uncharacterized protein n=1 Tax=Lophiotrema nucula TaxID=690887 RepID=A0A6A5YQ52_9PLEO|nr:hypothetical protein BDV96DRAFT_652105 [Lophiotrema nucula]